MPEEPKFTQFRNPKRYVELDDLMPVKGEPDKKEPIVLSKKPRMNKKNGKQQVAIFGLGLYGWIDCIFGIKEWDSFDSVYVGSLFSIGDRLGSRSMLQNFILDCRSKECGQTGGG